MSQRQLSAERQRVEVVREILREILPTSNDLVRQHWMLGAAVLVVAMFAGSGGTLLWLYEFATH